MTKISEFSGYKYGRKKGPKHYRLLLFSNPTMNCGIVLAFLVLALANVNGECNPGKYLVTMEKKELLDVVDCVSKSKDPLLCTKFAACERLMSPRVLFALNECKKEVVPDGIKRCTPSSIVFESKEVPEKIFDCVVEKIDKLTFPEKKLMLNFEECTKLLFEESCEKKKV